MLALARQRFAMLGLLERIDLHCGEVAGLPASPPYDAALLLLVLHFIRGDEAKLRFLETIAARLAPAAPLLLANLMEPRDAFERPVQAEACRLLGLSPKRPAACCNACATTSIALRAASWRIAHGERLRPARTLFQAVGYQAWIAFRAA
ncbi:Uncharacterised protein [Streptococcus dysgalactiae subsp. equisimilis]|nr:Uncharacterised protein [Streptococcus dysgalactiae subsp. equisimilis]